jgi:hypothetical protein
LICGCCNSNSSSNNSNSKSELDHHKFANGCKHGEGYKSVQKNFNEDDDKGGVETNYPNIIIIITIIIIIIIIIIIMRKRKMKIQKF